jgi:hypothetical protein
MRARIPCSVFREPFSEFTKPKPIIFSTVNGRFTDKKIAAEMDVTHGAGITLALASAGTVTVTVRVTATG